MYLRRAALEMVLYASHMKVCPAWGPDGMYGNDIKIKIQNLQKAAQYANKNLFFPDLTGYSRIDAIAINIIIKLYVPNFKKNTNSNLFNLHEICLTLRKNAPRVGKTYTSDLQALISSIEKKIVASQAWPTISGYSNADGIALYNFLIGLKLNNNTDLHLLFAIAIYLKGN